MVHLPEVGVRIPVSILMTVLLPAPLGPINPRISPLGTSKLMSSTATTRSVLGLKSDLKLPFRPGSLIVFLNSFLRFST